MAQYVSIGMLTKELNITIAEIQVTASFFGLKISGNQPHFQLTLHDANNIRNYYSRGEKEVPKEKQVPIKTASFTEKDDIPKSFLVDELYSNKTIELIQKEDRFVNRKAHQIEFYSDILNSIFTDEEAFSICGRISDSIARNLFNIFNYGTYNQSDKYQAHKIAMLALAKYGSTFLTFCLTLKPLPFKYGNVIELFSELEKRKKHTEVPILRVIHTNAFGEKEKLSISFYSITNVNERIRYKNIVQVKNETTKQILMKVTKSGVIIPEEGAREIIPIIQLFVRFAKDPQKFIISYGFETGECGVCGRRLTDPISIRYGIGPTCANSLGYRF